MAQFFHYCPIHGDEPCLMGEHARNHGCRNGLSFVFGGPVREKEIAVVSKVADYVRQVIQA